jgi:Osmosensitive K+ channel histidine kinase
MEQRLRKQRNRLFFRITLIALAVWLAISVTYVIIRVHSEKANLQNRTTANLSDAKRILSMSELSSPEASYVYINSYNLLYFKDMAGEDFDTQLIVLDPDSGKMLADTAGKIRMRISLMTDKGTYPDSVGYVDFSTVKDLMGETGFGQLLAALSSGKGEKTFPVCISRFYLEEEEIIPLELTIVSEEGDKIAAFPLRGGSGTNTVYRSPSLRHNLIPGQFFTGAAFNRDYISGLTEEQREKSAEAISLGDGDYLFYSSEYYFLDAFIYNERTKTYDNIPKLYILQYAKKDNLLRSCGSDLAWGIAVISGFFLLIWGILFLMIWNTVKNQMIQEQKRRDLTNALAHDIKTPLFVISGYAYTLKEDIDRDERELYLDKIIGQTEQINSLVHNMLNLSKLDSVGMTLNRSDFDLGELVGGIVGDFGNLRDGKTISFTRSGDNSISADRELLSTALQNLIENAVKYSPAGSEIRVDLSGRSVTISNPSEYISKADLKRIWQPYVRMDKSRHKKGNGLGLSIVRSILDLHGVKYEMTMKEDRLVFRVDF